MLSFIHSAIHKLRPVGNSWLVQFCCYLTLVLPVACIGVASFQETGVPENDIRLQTIDSCNMHVHFSGWKHYSEARKFVVQSLQRHNIKLSVNAPFLLDITFEQTGQTGRFHKFVNLILFLGSLTIVPFKEKFEYELRFRIRNAGGLILSRTYELDNNVYTSLLVLPLVSFYWPPDMRRAIIEEATEDFARKSLVYCK